MANEEFATFYEREYPAVVGLAAVLAGSRAAAEDLAQDAFVAAHRRWSEIRGYDSPEAWVRRVVANLALSWIRRRTRELRAMTRLGQRPPVPQDLEPRHEEFWAAVRSLPKRQAQCVALFYLEDRSVADIAKILDVSESTVRVHLHHGRRSLMLLLNESEEGQR